jgi:hypothetical protein
MKSVITPEEREILLGMATRLTADNESLRQDIAALEKELADNLQLVDAINGRLGITPVIVEEVVRPAAAGQIPFMDRVITACETFGQEDFDTRQVFNKLSELDLLKEGETMEMTGNYLWKRAKDKKIALVQRGAGKRPAKYRNAVETTLNLDDF